MEEVDGPLPAVPKVQRKRKQTADEAIQDEEPDDRYAKQRYCIAAWNDMYHKLQTGSDRGLTVFSDAADVKGVKFDVFTAWSPKLQQILSLPLQARSPLSLHMVSESN